LDIDKNYFCEKLFFDIFPQAKEFSPSKWWKKI